MEQSRVLGHHILLNKTSILSKKLKQRKEIEFYEQGGGVFLDHIVEDFQTLHEEKEVVSLQELKVTSS
jgi:hypothetical protein